MTAVIATIAAGHENEYAYRVNNNDPANAVFVVGALKTGHQVLTTLQEYDDLAALLAGTGNDEPTNTGYARVILDDTDVGDPTVDEASDEKRYTIADIAAALSAVAAGDDWSVMWIGYDSDSTGGADSAIIPVYLMELGTDFSPNGSDVDFDFPAILWAADAT